MEYHFDQNQGFSPEGISYEQPLTLKQVARPSIFGDPDFFWRREGQVILIPILTQLVPAVYSPPWVVLPTQGVG